MDHSAEKDRNSLRVWLLEPETDVGFEDPAHRRLADLCAALRSGSASPVEFAVVLRQVAARWKFLDNAPMEIARSFVEGVSSEALEKTGLRLTPNGARLLVEVLRWKPKWIELGGDVEADGASAAGTQRGFRSLPSDLRADRVFAEATGYEHYKTPGQCAALRVTLESDPAGVVIANLPTGSGKTEIAVTLARSFEETGGGTAVMIVPTIALAKDLEARFRRQWERLTGNKFAKVPFAWTSETSPEAQDQLKSRLRDGQQPLLVTSPESLTGRLLETVKTAAGNGRLRAIIVDEAHLVTQWGLGFRPEYRLLGPLWQELNGPLNGTVKAVLLSATLPADVLEDLLNQFPAPDGPYVVAANAIRAEPSFWVGPRTDRVEREKRIVEALCHLPRPCILYVTQPRVARDWQRRLVGEGFKRVVVVSGESTAAERERALNGVRTGQRASEFDIVVGTSAFGLGIDIDEMRTVIHACIPETPDRWYQEVGRGGRDGYVSGSFLVPADNDVGEAQSLGIDVLKPETAMVRWETMWQRSEAKNAKSFVNLRYAPPSASDGSYNRRWNAQVLDGLAALGVINRRVLSFDEVQSLGLPSSQQPQSGILPDAWFEVSLVNAPPDKEFFDRHWNDWKDQVEYRSRAALDQMKKYIKFGSACTAIAEAYEPTAQLENCLGRDVADGFGVASMCGRCPACRESGKAAFVEPAPKPRIRFAAPAAESIFGTTVKRFAYCPPYGELAPPNGVAVAVWDDGPNSGQLEELVRAGATLGAGASIASHRDLFRYFDDETDFHGMVPLPAVIGIEELRVQHLLDLRFRCSFAEDGSFAPVLLVTHGVESRLRSGTVTSLVRIIDQIRKCDR